MRPFALVVLLTTLALISACYRVSPSDGDVAGTATDSDADSDTDTDSDTDADSDTDGDTDTDADDTDTAWIELPAGSFWMGDDEGPSDEQPEHLVDVPAFEIMVTEVTVAQYAECVDDGECGEPEQGPNFNWNKPGYDQHPVNGVDWTEAVDYCTWAGARLTSEAEWEYAARSAGQEIAYPWGNELPSCDLAIVNDWGQGCGEYSTWAVCSKPPGNTEQGLCDMAGNVYEWVQDYYYPDYEDAPTDGSAQEVPPYDGAQERIVRGGSYQTPVDAHFLRTTARVDFNQWYPEPDLGFRCSRDPG